MYWFRSLSAASHGDKLGRWHCCCSANPAHPGSLLVVCLALAGATMCTRGRVGCRSREMVKGRDTTLVLVTQNVDGADLIVLDGRWRRGYGAGRRPKLILGAWCSRGHVSWLKTAQAVAKPACHAVAPTGYSPQRNFMFDSWFVCCNSGSRRAVRPGRHPR